MRLFIALEIERSVLQGLTPVFDMLSRHPLFLKAVPIDNCHVTLKFFGECRAGPSSDIVREFTSIKLPEGPIPYRLRGLGAYPNLARASVLWCGVETDGNALRDLNEAVELFAGRFGFPRETRSFKPHLTLARVRKGMKLTSQVAGYFRDSQEKEFALSSFTRLSLFSSSLTSRGPIYQVLAQSSLIFHLTPEM